GQPAGIRRKRGAASDTPAIAQVRHAEILPLMLFLPVLSIFPRGRYTARLRRCLSPASEFTSPAVARGFFMSSPGRGRVVMDQQIRAAGDVVSVAVVVGTLAKALPAIA